jgi:hypothetical protein
MSDQESDDNQVEWRFDALVRKLLKTPPKSQAELAEELRRARREKATRTRGKHAEKAGPACASPARSQ